MRGIDPAHLAPVDRYRLLINAIVPRPIAWITTREANGAINLAPFSFFNGVTASPPIISVSIAHRVPEKDTLRLLRATKEAVVHLVPGEQLLAMHGSGAEYPPGTSEAAALHLESHPALHIRGAVLNVAEIAFECRLLQTIPVGEPVTHLCLLEVVYVHVADAVARPDGLPDPQALRTVARLGGESYLTAAGWQVQQVARVKWPG